MFAKRLFDISASLFGLIFFSPLFLLITILIKVRMPGPVLFVQNRVGRDAKLFRMVKFRTMKVHHSGNSVSVKGEARITPLGAFLRRYKLDELPELWNVFKGDMSFVGPRPDVPGYADKLQGEDRLMLSLRPGITGPASLKYSNEEELLANQPDPLRYNDEVLFPDKVRINLHYIKHRSMWMDLGIIVFTLLRRRPLERWVESRK
jgi:lipopolysaccharide/colanic/teichoic acid biosynthesis glycosyltransferase